MTDLGAAQSGPYSQCSPGGVSPACEPPAPNPPVPGSPLPKRSRKAASPAIVTTSTKTGVPGAISKRRSRTHLKPLGRMSAEGRAIGDEQPSTITPDHFLRDANSDLAFHRNGAVAGDDQRDADTHPAPVIATITELWKRRQAWHRAEKSLTLQAKAICRRYCGGDKDEAEKLFATAGHLSPETQNDSAVTVAILPLLMARDTIEQHRSAVEKEATKLAKSLPVYQWAAGVRGFGALSLAALVGECGDIGGYKSVSAVWKRMGLAVIQGGRQRRVAGVEALEHGYSPERRSIAWNIGVCLMRSQKAGEPYRDFYDQEKERQLAKGITKAHAHNRACRHMTKRLLAELYGQWRKA